MKLNTISKIALLLMFTLSFSLLQAASNSHDEEQKEREAKNEKRTKVTIDKSHVTKSKARELLEVMEVNKERYSEDQLTLLKKATDHYTNIVSHFNEVEKANQNGVKVMSDGSEGPFKNIESKINWMESRVTEMSSFYNQIEEIHLTILDLRTPKQKAADAAKVAKVAADAAKAAQAAASAAAQAAADTPRVVFDTIILETDAANKERLASAAQQSVRELETKLQRQREIYKNNLALSVVFDAQEKRIDAEYEKKRSTVSMKDYNKVMPSYEELRNDARSSAANTRQEVQLSKGWMDSTVKKLAKAKLDAANLTLEAEKARDAATMTPEKQAKLDAQATALAIKKAEIVAEYLALVAAQKTEKAKELKAIADGLEVVSLQVADEAAQAAVDATVQAAADAAAQAAADAAAQAAADAAAEIPGGDGLGD